MGIVPGRARTACRITPTHTNSCIIGAASLQQPATNIRSLWVGRLFLAYLCSLELLDWWLPASDTNSAADAARFVPHICRAVLAVWCLAIVTRDFRRILSYRLAKAQLVWLFIITVRYAFSGGGTAQALLNSAIYISAPLVCWAVYVLIIKGKLTLHAVSAAGAIVLGLYSLRIILFKLAGVWIGAVPDTSSVNLEDSSKAAAYIILIFVSLTLIGQIRYWKILFAFFGMMVAGLAMERSAQVAILLGFPLLFYALQRTAPEKRRSLLALFGLTAALFFVVYAVNSELIRERWSDLQDTDTAGSGRTIIWAILLNAWWNGGTIAHLFGFGPFSVYAATSEYYIAGMSHAHNEWIQMLYECGLAGLVSYAVVMILLCRESIRLLRLRASGSPALCFATVVVLCRSMFDFFLSNSSALWYFLLLGAALGAASFSEQGAAPSLQRKHSKIARNALPKV
jgi:O-antigen ligase